MTWLYWDTFCALLGSLVWFMTIVSHPDAEVRAVQDWRSPRRAGRSERLPPVNVNPAHPGRS